MDNKLLKVLLVREKWNHMSEFSGFDPLFEEFTKHPLFNCTSVLVNEVKAIQQNAGQTSTKLLARVKRKLLPTANESQSTAERKLPFDRIPVKITPFIQYIHELAFDEIYLLDQKENFDFILFSVAENQFGEGLYAAPIKFKNKCVLFFHQPPSWLKLFWGDFKVLNEFRLLVTLSQHQYDFFERRVSCSLLKVRHGVNLDFFTLPSKNEKREVPIVLFVGSWLRDFELLAKTTQQLNKIGFNFELRCVIPKKDREQQGLLKLAREVNVTFYADLTPQTLKVLYQTADLLFLPLIDSTANNGLNEAMACGLPVVATNIGGIVDYIEPTHCLLAELDNIEDHANKIIQVLSNLTIQPRLAHDIRMHAESCLNWGDISNEIYIELNKKTHR